ncbi:MAG: T9SS type A sorting domain-containing protein [Ignavibacteria bacterium]|nr:T9SS type A sorting domain-containing protein [Ignavibacteria bacterium]
MKIIVLISILLLNLFSLKSQNQDFDENMTIGNGYTPGYSPFTITGIWSSYPNSPLSVSRSCCAYVEIGGIPYLYQFGGGNSTSEMKRVARLNLNTNSWQNNYSTMPHQISSGTAIPVNGGAEIYVFGGNNSPGVLGRTLKYDVASNSWQTKSDMPTKITDALVVKYSDQYIFIIGGGDGFFGSSAFKTNKVQLYNVSSNSYSYKNDYPISCAMLGGGIYRDTIIAIGGYTTGGVATANCYKGVINPSTLNIQWQTMPSYPGGPITRMASYTAVKNTGVGIVVTGGALGGTNPTARTYFWNFCTQSWFSGLPDNSLARSNFKACGKGYEKVYFASGYTNTGVGTTEAITFTNIDGPCMNMVGTGTNQNSIPSKFELKQNYPNPFNPSTKINFSLPSGGLVKLVVSNVAGRQILELTNRLYQAGNHSVDFNAENLSSGVYFYTIVAGEFTDTKKMLMIK